MEGARSIEAPDGGAPPEHDAGPDRDDAAPAPAPLSGDELILEHLEALERVELLENLELFE